MMRREIGKMVSKVDFAWHVCLLSAALVGAICVPAAGLTFERVAAYADSEANNASAVFFIDNHRVGAYRDGKLSIVDVENPGMTRQNIEVRNWDFVHDWESTQKGQGGGHSTYPILLWYDEDKSTMLVFHGVTQGEDNSARYLRFDLNKMKAEDDLFSDVGSWAERLYQGQDFKKRILSGYVKITARIVETLTHYSHFDSEVFKIAITWQRSTLTSEPQTLKRIETNLGGDSGKVGSALFPVSDVEWTDGRRFVLSNRYNTAVGYTEINPGTDESELLAIPGVYVFGINSYTKYPGIAPDTYSAGGRFVRVRGTWGRQILLVDGSPALGVIRQDGFPERYLATLPKQYAEEFRRDLILKPVVNYYGLNGGDTNYLNSARLSELSEWPILRYNERSLPFRLVVYDPLTTDVKDAGLPYYHLYSYYPFAVSPKGNLLAFAERDAATGLFKEWAVYRMVLDAQIDDDKVRYRDAPRTDGKILGTLDKGTRVKLLDRSNSMERIGDTQEYWYKVRLESGKEAWVFGAFITKLD